MWWKWLPWRHLLRSAARAHRFLDPLTVAARLRRFAQPSEMAEPIELLRAGVIFHARGLINSRVIQHNRDRVWLFWAERQFDPRDPALVPRAFSISHVNLGHRNWTAVGLPDSTVCRSPTRVAFSPLFWDGWSLDAWVITDGSPRAGRLLGRASGTQRLLLPGRFLGHRRSRESGLADAARRKVAAGGGFAAEAERRRGATERSLEYVGRRLAVPGTPASPYRRMD